MRLNDLFAYRGLISNTECERCKLWLIVKHSNALKLNISLTPPVSDRLRLEALVANWNTPQKHVWRARIVLLSTNGHGMHANMR
ncbi:hypothetical protein JHFBIEKO_4080 [Methylobacterium mesophilicum]|nr:hypothetical protein JHFBIEKO_4080 [Methylobacterium mesophilicum]